MSTRSRHFLGVFHYIFNILIPNLKMVSSKPKHVATFSEIVYVIKFCCTKIIFLLIIKLH